MNRRGYYISATILLIDLLCYRFGGALIAVTTVISVVGIGEYIAKQKYRAITCDSTLGGKHEKLANCYQRVREKIQEAGYHVPTNLKVCLIPSEEMNAYCFGSNSIGVTEAILNLDNKTVEAIIAHEMGHIFNGDSILNMTLVVNCVGIITILTFYQFALIAVFYTLMIIFYLIGLFRFSFASYFITNKIARLITISLGTIKTVVLKISHVVILAFARDSEFLADRFAAGIGYAFFFKEIP